MIVEKEINQIEVGHYILDIVKQTGSYSLSAPGNVKSAKIIAALAHKGVQSVLIDTSKTIAPEAENFNHDEKEPLKLELTKAKKIFEKSKRVQRQVFEDAFNGREINIEPVQSVTDDTIDAVFKNPDALACVINIRNKDEYLLEHSISVSVLMTIFARFLKIDRQIVQQLAIGAFLHDVGKIMIPDNILNKPSKLSEQEFTVMKTHVNHSIEIIERTPGISEISKEVAALHHEKLNAKGYPYKLGERDITKYGRMIAICDIFDALTAHRVYKDGYSHIRAFSILRRLATLGELDTRYVDLFIKCMGVYPVGSLVELSNSKLAIVESRNKQDPIKPKVRSFYNVAEQRYVMTEDVDLARADQHIVKGVRADDFDLDMNRIVEFLLMQG